ncbi:NAD-dependent epimerase/dehydratase family protein [Geobacter sp. SVR]|nr:NAD-dependent epimerase/dehydratase family protein [Geobacter sp. SVR]
MSKKHDVIINCIGVGTQRKIRGDYTKYFIVGEKFDNMIIEYLQNYSPETLYINISSGAVYGRSFTGPVSEWSENALTVNHIMQEDYYSICKLNSEAKHRAFSHLKIVDLRLFSYFSRFADISDGYFITDIIDSIKSNKKLKTNTTNIIRDYVHPVDLCSIVHICIQINNINDAYDVMSTKPVNKTEILDYFSKNYGLKYSIDSSIVEQTPTGVKDIYYSKYFKIAKIGYIPSYSSLDTVIQEASYLLEDKK